MNLPFVPGKLHLTQNAEGSYIVTIAGQNILSTKSKRVALARFNSIRGELERRFPKQEPTAEGKSDLLRREVNASVVKHERVIHFYNTPAAPISASALAEVETALRGYCAVVDSSDLKAGSKAMYMDIADAFVRWLKGDFMPGSRGAPYRRKK